MLDQRTNIPCHRILVTVQNWSNRGVSLCMVLSFWLQLILGLTLNFAIADMYWPTTAHPLMRLPVFIMGVVATTAGLLATTFPETLGEELPETMEDAFR